MISKEQILEKLQAKTIKDELTGCWLWQGADDGGDGHGKIWIGHLETSVSRASAHVHLDLELDSKMYALHKNSCPNKNCWNPEHLYVGTASDNVQDSIQKGTYIAPGKFKETCKYGHPLDGLRGNGKRYCKTCNRFRSNLNYIPAKIMKG